MDRIHQRGREIESSISREYLELLDSFYEDWIRNFDLCPVLTIRTDDLDFVHEPKHLNTVVQKIKEKLSGKEEIVF
jgi:deoxyadenosine/deoxycytidine kinase